MRKSSAKWRGPFTFAAAGEAVVHKRRLLELSLIAALPISPIWTGCRFAAHSRIEAEECVRLAIAPREARERNASDEFRRKKSALENLTAPPL